MSHLNLNHQQYLDLKAALKRARRANGCPRQALRLNVILCLAKGLSIVDIVEFLEIDEETVRTYRDKYSSGGIKGLLNKAYQGSESFLSQLQLKVLLNELRTHRHRTTDSVRAWIKKAFGILYSRSGMTRLLHRLRFSYKKPKKTSYKTSVTDQKVFLSSVLKPCLKKANTEHFFLDAAHPTLETKTDYGWFEKGKESIIPYQGTRKRLNLLGSVALHGKHIYMDYPEKIDKEAIVKHVLRVVNRVASDKRVVIILDNASCHKSAAKDPRLRCMSRLKLLFLPVASPALNLAERLWWALKKQVINNQFIESVPTLKSAVKSKLARWRAFPQEIAKLFAPNFHLYEDANFY